MGASTSTLTTLVREGNLAELEAGVREHGRFCLNQRLDGAGTTCLILAARSHRPHIVQVRPVRHSHQNITGICAIVLIASMITATPTTTGLVTRPAGTPRR
eukprot:COSAG01_NODE_7810_length_3046_cov_26.887343_3_plen_101_part_00